MCLLHNSALKQPNWLLFFSFYLLKTICWKCCITQAQNRHIKLHHFGILNPALSHSDSNIIGTFSTELHILQLSSTPFSLSLLSFLCLNSVILLSSLLFSTVSPPILSLWLQCLASPTFCYTLLVFQWNFFLICHHH